MRSKTDRLYRLWALAAVYFCLVLAFYGVSFWLPQILQQLSHYRRASSRSSLPCRTSLGPWAWSSSAPGRNRTGERRWHVPRPRCSGRRGLPLPPPCRRRSSCPSPRYRSPPSASATRWAVLVRADGIPARSSGGRGAPSHRRADRAAVARMTTAGRGPHEDVETFPLRGGLLS